jgi:DNA-binding NarL/FixJ family response regulator
LRFARILLADDHRLFRDALRLLIDAEPDLKVVGEAGDGLEAVVLTRELTPDLLLLDLAMPHMDGIAALESIASSPSATRTVLVTARIDKDAIATALHLGARGLVLKESGSIVLLKAIRAVLQGHYWVGREAVSDLMASMHSAAARGTDGVRPPRFGLTVRELQIVAAVVDAYGNREIAQQFNISEKTVKHHLTNIFDKVGVSTRLELALFALHHGLAARASP